MRAKIIAEITSNHGGSIELAKKMVQAAAAAGADYIKFQSWRADNLWKDNPEKRELPNYKVDYDYYDKHQLSDDDHKQLIDECKAAGVKFLTTCFDLDRVEFLGSLGLESIKVASPDMTSWKLLGELAARFPHMIISTGMHSNAEILEMIGKMKEFVGDASKMMERFTVLHCMSRYPTDPQYANLARMKWIMGQGVETGLSDHSLGTDTAKTAIAMGAAYVEKHFTLDRTMDGRDQKMSTLPHELEEVSRYARLVETMEGTAEPEMTAYDDMLRENYIGKWGNNR